MCSSQFMPNLWQVSRHTSKEHDCVSGCSPSASMKKRPSLYLACGSSLHLPRGLEKRMIRLQLPGKPPSRGPTSAFLNWCSCGPCSLRMCTSLCTPQANTPIHRHCPKFVDLILAFRLKRNMVQESLGRSGDEGWWGLRPTPKQDIPTRHDSDYKMVAIQLRHYNALFPSKISYRRTAGRHSKSVLIEHFRQAWKFRNFNDHQCNGLVWVLVS